MPMNINIEFFDIEAIENIITCMHFKMDRVVFLGQHDIMTPEAQSITRAALDDICNITNVSFFEVSMKDIDRVLQQLTKIVQQEEQQGGKCFFDLTGGADMLLVAMGMYSATHNIPMHRYDVAEGALKILNKDAEHIDDCVESREVRLTIDDLVELHGGVIDYNMQKKFKDDPLDGSFRQDVKNIWQIAEPNMRRYNGMSSVLKATKTTDDHELDEWLSRQKVSRVASNEHTVGSEGAFIAYLKSLERIGCVENLVVNTDWISFRYKDSALRSCLLDAGSVLELHTYYERLESGLYDDCKIGTHLKWGINAADDGYIVNNEIDVLLLKGNVLTFVSCKGGTPDQKALYELDTVASRFGGKYAVKELVTAARVDIHHKQRAEEMQISVIEI